MTAALCLLLTAAAPAAPPMPAQIAEAVKQLGDDSFPVRDRATRFLWEAGKASEAALIEAMLSDDPEVQRRARHLLNRIQWGVAPGTPHAMVELIERFLNGSADRQMEVVRDLLRQGPTA